MKFESEQILSALADPGTLNLFPTENRMSPDALRALSMDAVHRYPASQGPGYFYGNVPSLNTVYSGCEELCKRYFGARHAFINCLSGLHAMQTVLMALTNVGDRVMIMDPTCGGHYATEQICRRFGLDPYFLPFDRAKSLLDLDRVRLLTQQIRPKLVYLDTSILVRFPRLADLRGALGKEPLLSFDASQVLGLLPASPYGTGLDTGVTTCSGSTHKTFPGPQKAIIMTNDKEIAETVAGRLSYTVSSSHSNSVGALAITFGELMEHRTVYAQSVVRNSVALATSLYDLGFKVPGESFNFSETHQVWIEADDNVDAVDWGQRLLDAKIRVTVVTLPATGRPGIRLGTQELTRLGMGADEMAEVARLFHACLKTTTKPETVYREVTNLTNMFQTVNYC